MTTYRDYGLVINVKIRTMEAVILTNLWSFHFVDVREEFPKLELGEHY